MLTRTYKTLRRENKIMKILCAPTFAKQLEVLLGDYTQEDFAAIKSFKMYLDTIILNMPTKIQKFKKSIYFNDENIKDIEHQGLIIPFYIDEKTGDYLILGIVKK